MSEELTTTQKALRIREWMQLRWLEDAEVRAEVPPEDAAILFGVTEDCD